MFRESSMLALKAEVFPACNDRSLSVDVCRSDVILIIGLLERLVVITALVKLPTRDPCVYYLFEAALGLERG